MRIGFSAQCSTYAIPESWDIVTRWQFISGVDIHLDLSGIDKPANAQLHTNNDKTDDYMERIKVPLDESAADYDKVIATYYADKTWILSNLKFHPSDQTSDVVIFIIWYPHPLISFLIYFLKTDE